MNKPKVEILTNNNDQVNTHRWRITAENGEVIGASTQGYSRRIDAVNNMAQVAAAIMGWCRETDSE